MTPSCQGGGRRINLFSARLFMAAFLSFRKKIGLRRRAGIIAGVDPGNPFDPGKVIYESGAGSPRSKEIDRALAVSDAWIHQGIRAVTASEAGFSASNPEIPGVLFTKGEQALFYPPKSIILNSRKPKAMTPHDPWIVVSRKMFQASDAAGPVHVVSYGERQYELAWRMAAGARRPCLVICPDILPWMSHHDHGSGFERTYRDFIDSGPTLFASPFSPGALPPRRTKGIIRDILAVEAADPVWAAEVRSGGILESLTEKALRSGCRVHAAVFPKVKKGNAGARLLMKAGAAPFEVSELEGEEPLKVKPECTRKIGALELDGRLMHFTRARPGPWPGQSIYDYYGSLLNGEPGAAHTGYDALKRILEEKLVRGSGLMTRGKVPVVSFTSLGAVSLGRLMRWRTSLARWTVEPYGLAVDKRALRRLGAQPVIYGDEEVLSKIPENARFRFQMQGRDGEAWRAEKEWRLKGNLDLSLLEPRQLCVMVPGAREAEEIESLFGLQTVILFPGAES